MDALKIRHAAAMPAPTWSWLRMNDTTIAVPADLARGGMMGIDAGEQLTSTSESFEGAIAGLQERIDAERTDADDTRACVRSARGENARPAEANDAADLGDLDLPALSAYQRRATLDEVAGDVAASFETGVGIDARSYLNFLAGETVTFAAKPDATEQAAVHLRGVQGEAGAASIDVVAAAGSTLDVVISLDGTSETQGSAAEGTTGFIGSELRVFAGAHAHVNVTVYVTADAGFTVVDDSGYVLDEGARVNVRHVVLGGGFVATGLAADLRGDTARIDIDTRYLAAGSDVRDFNYVVRHRGRKTVSQIMANGVLAGTSKKVLRGTIDLIHGCKGSEGTERETVLLANQGVDNKTVPTILCDEDDVAGNHGATIGHVRPDQLFYLASRGISPEAAEGLFMRAKLEDAYLGAPDDTIRDNVRRLGAALFPDFEEDLA
ncbi:SufD family Fe-S cluster assembly protein [Collinsella sp. An2]|uniref:SufB/SufD family protein n=1 Tax=Collinsella sp. An2 TaxID=1965585 RepID=UPI000B395A3C|nr:SufD family Fe-S cluster assembly protein [Collinsella sp. An2]OUP10045.1 ABC transporter permease [Collinsella sp. An2]